MGIATSQIYLMQKFNKEVVLPKVLENSNDKVNLTIVTELKRTYASRNALLAQEIGKAYD